MTATTAIQIPPATQANSVNGVDVDQLNFVIASIGADPAFGQFKFRAKNRWMGGGLNRSEIKDFYAGGQEDATRKDAFVLDADEPPLIAGHDTAPNPVEYVLHALLGCLTTTLVYHASVRDIAIENIESHVEGDMDLRGLFGMSEDVRKGFNHIRVTLRVKSTADVETLTELATFSAVYDIVAQSLPVQLTIEKA
jgi:uncharacterized OsmC-like protein